MLSRIAAALALLALVPGALIRTGANAILLEPEVSAQLAASGVQSQVTAVLLNFRSLDTLLEVSVLSGAVIGTLALPPAPPPPRNVPPYSLLPTWFIPRLGVIISLLVVYLWWAGSHQPGGAFQAGAALTGLLLLLHFIERPRPTMAPSDAWFRLSAAGPLIFLAAGTLPLLGGRALLDYPGTWSKAIILTVEAGLTASIGAALTLLATGGGGRPHESREDSTAG